MSIFLSALLMGIGLKINQFREGEGGITTYTPSLDFSDARNSQYFTIILGGYG